LLKVLEDDLAKYNVMPNGNLVDSDSDGVPDGYELSAVGEGATVPQATVHADGIFCLKQNNGKGWAAAVIEAGEFPPGAELEFSVLMSARAIGGDVTPYLFTRSPQCFDWGCNHTVLFSQLVSAEDGWSRFTQRIRLNDTAGIAVSAAIAGWHYGYADGEVCVRSPTLRVLHPSSPAQTD